MGGILFSLGWDGPRRGRLVGHRSLYLNDLVEHIAPWNPDKFDKTGHLVSANALGACVNFHSPIQGTDEMRAGNTALTSIERFTDKQ